jgi:hypothetical protein
MRENAEPREGIGAGVDNGRPATYAHSVPQEPRRAARGKILHKKWSARCRALPGRMR